MERGQYHGEAKHVYINECQFFIDLKPFVLQCLKQEKCLFVWFRWNFRQNIFGQTMELIPYCNYLEKVKGICQIVIMIHYKLSKQQTKSYIYWIRLVIYLCVCYVIKICYKYYKKI